MIQEKLLALASRTWTRMLDCSEFPLTPSLASVVLAASLGTFSFQSSAQQDAVLLDQSAAYSFCRSKAAERRVELSATFGEEWIGESQCSHGQTSADSWGYQAQVQIDMHHSGNYQWYYYETGIYSILSFDRLKNAGCAGDLAGQCPLLVGNPINIATGAKYQVETDLPGYPSSGLAFKRYYSHDGADRPDSTLGDRWRGTYDRSVELWDSSGTPTAVAYRHDGAGYYFLGDAGGNWVPDSDIKLTLVRINQATSPAGWLLTDAQDNREIYDSQGRLDRIEFSDGDYQDLTYLDGRLYRVTARSGRFLEFTYGPDGRLITLKAPDGSTTSYSYSNGLLSTALRADGSFKEYLYDEAAYASAPAASDGALTGIVDESGNRYGSYFYDADGRATVSLHGAGADRVEVEYESGGSAVVTDSLGRSTTRYFESAARSMRFISSSGLSTIDGNGYQNVSYDGNGYINQATDFVGTKFDRDYDPRGLLVQQIDNVDNLEGSRRTVQTDWDSVYRVPVARRVFNDQDVLVESSHWTYNSRGQVLTHSLSDPAAGQSRTWVSTYCESGGIAGGSCPSLGLLNSVDGPRAGASDATTLTYRLSDANGCASSPYACSYRKGDLWKVTNGLGQVTETLAYDGAGRPRSIKDPNGVITDYDYHDRGWLTAVKVRGANNSTESDDRITRMEYWPTGLVKKVTLPNGAVTSYAYDAAHRLTQVSDNASNKIVYTLDNASNRIKEEIKNSGGTLKATLSRVYNQLGQLATAADASANPTDFSYDANGNTIGSEDALGRTTSYAFDALNRLQESIQDTAGIKAKTQQKYNALNEVTEVTDPKGLKTTYKYNGFGDLTELKSPDTGTTTYTYDEAGNVKTAKDARGKTATYAYDGLNRVISIGYASTALNVTYGYDTAGTACASGETFAKGRLSSMIDGAGTTQYCYNRFGDMVRKVQTINGVSLTLRYTYAANGNLTGMVYPDNMVVDYTRDVQGRVTAVGVTRPAASREVVLSQASYHPFGPVASWTYGNGRTMTRPVDLDYRPLAIVDSAADGLQVGFGYDPVGNLTSLNSATNTTPQLAISYDALGRLTSLSDPNTAQPLEAYTYDATGNRTSAKQNGVTKAYTYVSTSHRLTNVGGLARSYAADGSTTALSGTTKQYTYDDTGRMQQAKNGSTVVMNYRYNGRGERTRAYLGSANTYTLYDEAGHWLGDYGNNGAVIQQAIWMDDLPVGVVTTAKTHYIQPDHLGTPRAVIDPASNKAIWSWSIRGEAFGNTAPNEDPDQDGQAFVFNLRFPGQRYDAASGLNYNYFRDYDPITGRYVQSDPIGLLGGASTYVYALGDSLQFTDTFGLRTEVVYWHGVGSGSSQFGHISTNINGRNFSWTPPGQWDTKYQSSAEYNARQQTFRDGSGVILNLSAEQEIALAACMSSASGEYNLFSNNCGTSIQDCLKKIGLEFDRSLRPSAIYENLMNSPWSSGGTKYPGPSRDGGVMANPALWGY